MHAIVALGRRNTIPLLRFSPLLGDATTGGDLPDAASSSDAMRHSMKAAAAAAPFSSTSASSSKVMKPVGRCWICSSTTHSDQDCPTMRVAIARSLKSLTERSSVADLSAHGRVIKDGAKVRDVPSDGISRSHTRTTYPEHVVCWLISE